MPHYTEQEFHFSESKALIQNIHEEIRHCEYIHSIQEELIYLPFDISFPFHLCQVLEILSLQYCCILMFIESELLRCREKN